jgi:ABC-type glycerol-3-phosphate transport system substrate-binding protein
MAVWITDRPQAEKAQWHVPCIRIAWTEHNEEDERDTMKKMCCTLALMLVLAGLAACSRPPAPPPRADQKEEPVVIVGPVKINPHPSSLTGKTVVLRWNGNCNGDTFLNNLAGRLKNEVKQVRIVKMWEVDPDTAVVSRDLAKSQAIATAIAAQKPALVIAAQADSN